MNRVRVSGLIPTDRKQVEKLAQFQSSLNEQPEYKELWNFLDELIFDFQKKVNEHGSH